MLPMHFMTKQKKSNRTAACLKMAGADMEVMTVSYTHLRAHET